MDILDRILLLISEINITYQKLNNDWLEYLKLEQQDFLNEKGLPKISLKKNTVKYIKTNPYLFNLIEAYRTFVVENTFYFDTLDVDRFRIKTANSILSKTETYTLLKIEKGNVPIIKCLNDICGLRIEIDDKYTFDEIISKVKSCYPTIKIISKGFEKGYRAIHIYFTNGNYYFPLELQIWYKKDHNANTLSHYKFKQAYVNWEDINKNNDISKKEGGR